MKRRVLALLVSSALTAIAASRGCVGSVSVASFRLSAQPAGSGTSWVPIRQVNNIPSGYRISYQPLDLPADLRKDAKLTFVMVPKASDGQVTVLEPRLAASSTEWTAPFTSSIAVLVFAPQGLDEKRLTNLVTKDPNLVAALADYADQTAQLEAALGVSYAIRTDPLDSPALLSVECAEPVRTIRAEKLHVGEKNPNAQLTGSEDGTLFLSLDPGSVGQSGCSLTATIETESLGKSDPVPLGKVVRLPRIEAFSLTEEKSADGYYGVIRGFDLETIERTGWDSKAGLNAPELPRPVAGEGAKQTLRIVMPWPSPSPKAPLFVWLRGETEGRATKVTQ